MAPISKEEYDIAAVFTAYLAYLGNCTKVGIALSILPEAVEVLAAKEDWPAKLRTYMAFRHSGELSPTERTVRRAVIDVQARQLQEVLARVIDHLHNTPADETILAWLSPQNAKTNRPQFRASVLLDLARALLLLNRILERNGDGLESEAEVERADRLSLAEALQRAMDAADGLPGVDSVALAKESLAKWESKTAEGKGAR